MYTSASAMGSTSSASMPAGAVLADGATLAEPLVGGAVGSAREAAPALLAEAAPRTLSWNLACAFFFRRHVHQPYTMSRRTSAASSPRYIGLSRNSSTML